FFPQAAKRAGWIVNDHSPCPLRHVGFGLVQADDFDRFQTLSTKVVSLVNLFEEAKSLFKAILVGQAAEKLEHTAEALGYDAVKYAVLKANRLSNYTINFDEMCNEKEDTVVYLQYTHVQISSILEKFRSRIDGLKESTVRYKYAAVAYVKSANLAVGLSCYKRCALRFFFNITRDVLDDN
ncbi:anticodon-binding aminoacyl-tRNA synthetase, class 1a, partial [Tanacetum coccineum]